MYKKKILKSQNSKNASDNPTKGSSKILVHRTNANSTNQTQKTNHPHQSHPHPTNKHKPEKSVPTKNYSISSETVKKILLSFYPEDKALFDIILSPLNKATFLYDLDKYYSKLDEFSNKDPFNKYYGVQSSIKLITKENQSSLELNKQNTDIIFS